MRASFLSFVLLAAPLTGCAGLTIGESIPGQDTYLEYGDIAVDDRTDTSFVLATAGATADDRSPRKILYGVDPDTGVAREASDLTDGSDARILFPDSGVLVLSEHHGRDHLELLDARTFAPVAARDADVRYRGARLSASRRWIAAADDTSARSPLHLIDAASPDLTTRLIPHDGDWLEATWLHEQDRLFAIVFHGTSDPSSSGSGAAGTHARILSWSLDQLEDADFKADESGHWAEPELEIPLPGVTSDERFSFTWIGVSPDDRWVVFPVLRVEGERIHELIVLDTRSGEIRTVPGAMGPVGFTPDSSTLISYDNSPASAAGEVDQRLLLIDIETLEVDPQEVPIDGAVQFFVSHQGNFVVAASNLGDQRLTLVDVDEGGQTQMPGPEVGLWEIVSRTDAGELWLVDDQALYRLDLFEGRFDAVPTPFAPEHINLLPNRDRLVLDDALSPELHFLDPDTLETTLRAELPDPAPQHQRSQP